MSDNLTTLAFIGIQQCLNHFNNTSFTVERCIAECGAGGHPWASGEVVNAVATWMLPLFLLVGNVEYANVQFGAPKRKREYPRLGLGDVLLSRMVVASRLLGNPILYIHAHLEKLERMRHLQLTVEDKSAAIICIALTDFPNHEILIARVQGARSNNSAFQKSALLLAKSRISSTRRSALAVLLYAANLFVSLKSAMSAKDIPPHSPHTLALRVL